jgi:hypothetical protein
MAKLFGASIENLHVIGYDEIPENRQVRVVASIGNEQVNGAVAHAA